MSAPTRTRPSQPSSPDQAGAPGLFVTGAALGVAGLALGLDNNIMTNVE